MSNEFLRFKLTLINTQFDKVLSEYETPHVNCEYNFILYIHYHWIWLKKNFNQTLILTQDRIIIGVALRALLIHISVFICATCTTDTPSQNPYNNHMVINTAKCRVFDCVYT